MENSNSNDKQSIKEDSNNLLDSNKPGNKFSVELTVSQANAINKILPKRYFLVVQREVKTKRNPKKKNPQSKKEASSNIYQFQQPSQRTKKMPNRYSQQIVQLNNYSRASSQIYDDVDDILKPCMRILNLLKGHRCAWPFKSPVDPVALNIPNYFQIIKEPMDLQTVEQNIHSKQYITPTQFHGDIAKIIKNSYLFNKDNPDFVKLTNQFQKFYIKISSDLNRNQGGSLNSINSEMRKKSKQGSRAGELSRENSQSNPITLQQKKELALEIRKLPKQYLLEVAQLVYKDKAPTSQQLNLEALSSDKLRQLQKLVRQKLAFLRLNSETKKEERNNNEVRSQQSSFESDSDS